MKNNLKLTKTEIIRFWLETVAFVMLMVVMLFCYIAF